MRRTQYITLLLVAFNLPLIPGIAQKIKLPVERIKMTSLVRAFQQEEGIVIVNFWSTWCKPCIEEIPGFLQVLQEEGNQQVQLWLVSQDTRELYEKGKLQQFLTARKWGARMFWLDETNADYYCPMIDISWSGVVPATLIRNNKTGFVHFTEEALTPDQFRQLLQAATK